MTDYNGFNGFNQGFDRVTNPFGDDKNSFALINRRIENSGTALVEIRATTELSINVKLRSFMLDNYENKGKTNPARKTPGAYYNAHYGRIWRGINSKSVLDGSIQNNFNYYSGIDLPKGPEYNWTALTIDTLSDTLVDINMTTSEILHKNQYLVYLITGPETPDFDYAFTGMVLLTGLPTPSGTCFGAESKVLMANGDYKCIKDIKRGDIVMQDDKTKTTAIVSKVCSDIIMSDIVHIPIGLLGNKEEIICTQLHPIWMDNDTVRIWAKDIHGVSVKHECGEFYNLQFDEEGTYIVDSIKVDSLSPYHKYSPLPKELFIDQNKFIPDKKIKDENDPTRNKPILKVKTNRRKQINNPQIIDQKIVQQQMVCA